MEEYIKHKRTNASIYLWGNKLYIPVPLGTKNEFTKVARLNGLSQAELGAVIVMHYLANRALLMMAIEEYKKTEAKLRSEYLEDMASKDKARRADRTFGGVFNSSFPESDEDEEK